MQLYIEGDYSTVVCRGEYGTVVYRGEYGTVEYIGRIWYSHHFHTDCFRLVKTSCSQLYCPLKTCPSIFIKM